MRTKQAPQHEQDIQDRPTSHKPTNTSRAGIRMPSAARLAGSEA